MVGEIEELLNEADKKLREGIKYEKQGITTGNLGKLERARMHVQRAISELLTIKES